MKKILILTMLFFYSLLSAEDIYWNTYKKTYEMMEDKILDKPVFVFVSATGCSYCEEMKNKMNNSVQFKNFIVEHYTTVLIDQTKDFVPADLYSFSTPSFYVLNPRDMELLLKDPAIGAIPLKDMLNWLSNISLKYNSMESK